MKKSQLTTGVTLPLNAEEIDRIHAVAGKHGGLENWLRSTLIGVLELDEDQESVEAEKSSDDWTPADYFRPLTPRIIARHLRSMKARWYQHDDRDFDVVDTFEEWMLDVLINSIDRGGLALKTAPVNPN